MSQAVGDPLEAPNKFLAEKVAAYKIFYVVVVNTSTNVGYHAVGQSIYTIL